VEAAPPTIPFEATEPFWNIPVPGTQTHRSTLSQGVSSKLSTHFMLTPTDRILTNNGAQSPRLIEMMGYDRQECFTSAIEFEKASIQHRDAASPLNFV
jgi:hypothetical protein